MCQVNIVDDLRAKLIAEANLDYSSNSIFDEAVEV